MLLRRYMSMVLAIVMLLGCFGGANVFAAENYFKADMLIEAEAGSVKNNMYIFNSPSASGGQYCSSTKAILQLADVKEDELSFIFDIVEKGEYRMFMRLYGDSKSLFFRWDNDSWKTLSIPKAEDYAWIEIGKDNINPGKHKFQICHNSPDALIDALYLTSKVDFVPAEPEGVEKMPPAVSARMRYSQEQKNEIILKNDEGVIVEAEDLKLSTNVSIANNPDMSGGKYVYFSSGSSDIPIPNLGDDGDIEMTFKVAEAGTYYIWAKFYASDVGSDSVYVQGYDKSAWWMKEFTRNVHIWVPLNSGRTTSLVGNMGSDDLTKNTFEAGETVTFRLHRREAKLIIDQLVIVPKSTYIPNGNISKIDLEIAELVPISGYPQYNPPAGVHPRLMFREEDIPRLKEKLEHPENAIFKEKFDKYVKTPIDIGTVYSESKVYHVESKAYYYALYGDEKIGREAVDAALEMTSWSYAGSIQRTAGRNMFSMSLVYDWCYDIMTDEERLTLIEGCVGCARQMEISWPPFGHQWSTMSGHGAEAQLLRDMLGFAIATYDERPDFWNYIGGRFYNEYVDERQWETQTDYHHQGSNYGYYRVGYNIWAYQLITGMGLPEPYDGKALAKYAYPHQIYARRPDGTLFVKGDTYDNLLMEFNEPDEDNILGALNVSKDPYIKDILMRYVYDIGNTGIIAKDPSENGPVFWLMFNEPEVEVKSISNLPLSRYSPEPGGIMFARTGWETGVESDVACVQLCIGYTWQVNGGHDQLDLGDFQIYYKGPLVSDAAYYRYWGHEHHGVYSNGTIPHNTMLVYDPDEPLDNFYRSYSFKKVNDGGQMVKSNRQILQDEFARMMESPDVYNVSKVTGHEIDPKNPVEPDYTYLSGDLTNAYSDKVKEFKRSFMFLNFKDEKVPAALIVFDKVTSSNPKFKKTWLLHGQSYPEFDGNRSIWYSDPYTNTYGEKYTGKMIADHLLPKKYDMDVIGNEEDGWYIVNGENIPNPDDSVVAEAQRVEAETYRLEISESGKETSYFLNCMQVTDGDNESYLSPEMIDTNEFYGVKISDRAVLFSKSGARLTEKFSISSNGKNYKYTVCDVEKGSWKVNIDGVEEVIEVTEEGGVLSFETAGKNITAEPIKDAEIKEAPKAEVVLKNETEVNVKIEKTLIGMPVKSKLVNGKVMVPVNVLKNKMEITQEKGFMKEVFTDSRQQITVDVIEGANEIIVNGTPVKTTNKAYYENGYLMVDIRPFAEAFNFVVIWDDLHKNVFLYPNKKFIHMVPEGYAKFIKGSNDEVGDIERGYSAPNVYDGDMYGVSVWSCQGLGRYMTLELEKKEVIENIEIIFNPGGARSQVFDIQVSTDGENFETIYSGAGALGCDGVTWEVFTFDPDKDIEAKYVRYVGYGSNLTKWNALREVRVKIGKPIYRWEELPSYVEISGVTGDGSEPQESNLNSVIDNNSRTLWKVMEKGRYITLELKDEEMVSGVGLMFDKTEKRTAKFEIHVSEDGENFTKVYDGRSNQDASKNEMENFKFKEAVKAKYVRFVGLGNNLNPWTSVNELRVIK